MRRPRWFLAAFLLFGGWGVHLLWGYLWGITAPAPQIPLLMVLAVGALGRTDAAQTLGFLWGLMLDVQGVTLFGCQGWILAVLGFSAGMLSRQLDGEKLSAQFLMAGGGTVFHLAALVQVELLFRPEGLPHVPAFRMAVFQILMNLVAAPVVFRTVQWAERRLQPSGGGHVFRS